VAGDDSSKHTTWLYLHFLHCISFGEQPTAKYKFTWIILPSLFSCFLVYLRRIHSNCFKPWNRNMSKTDQQDVKNSVPSAISFFFFFFFFCMKTRSLCMVFSLINNSLKEPNDLQMLKWIELWIRLKRHLAVMENTSLMSPASYQHVKQTAFLTHIVNYTCAFMIDNVLILVERKACRVLWPYIALWLKISAFTALQG